MTTLHDVPAVRRRRLAMLMAPAALALLAGGVAVTVLAGSWVERLAGIAVFVTAGLLLAISTGLRASARADEILASEATVDAAINQATAGQPCGTECGDAGCAVTDCAVKSLPRQ